MSPREFHSGERVFSVALPQPVQSPDEETDAELIEPVDTPDVALPQPVPASDEESPVVTIYVRKGDHPKERIISINPIPLGIHPLSLLDAGFALDGNSATISIDPYTFVRHYSGKEALTKSGLHDEIAGVPHVASFDHWVPGGKLPGEWAATWTLTKALTIAEMALVGWLQTLGYRVKFG